MRIMILVVLLISSIAIKAQTPLPITSVDYMQRGALGNNINTGDTTATSNKKWFLTSYSSISTGMSFFNGGSAYFISAPIGLQLNRKLTNNLYAFAGVSVAPAYMNFNHSFLSADINKSNPNNGFYRTNSFGIYSRAEMGLMYINDAKTFSISGSIGIERNSNPIFINKPVNNTRLNSSTPFNR